MCTRDIIPEIFGNSSNQYRQSEKNVQCRRETIYCWPLFMTMHVLHKNQASADFPTECENGHFLSIEPTGKITQLARKGIIWTSTRCSRAWTVNKPSKSTEVCAVCLLFWHFPHLSTIWKFSRYILCTRMWRPGESFNKDLTRTVFSSHCSFCRWLLLLNWMVKFILTRLGHWTPTLVLSFAPLGAEAARCRLKCSSWKNIKYIG